MKRVTVATYGVFVVVLCLEWIVWHQPHRGSDFESVAFFARQVLLIALAAFAFVDGRRWRALVLPILVAVVSTTIVGVLGFAVGGWNVHGLEPAIFFATAVVNELCAGVDGVIGCVLGYWLARRRESVPVE